MVSIQATSLIQLIKRISRDERKASLPTNIITGKVTSVKPLKIKITSKIILDSDFFYTTETFSEKIKEDKVKINDKVVMIRADGGQSYLIIDKAVM